MSKTTSSQLSTLNPQPSRNERLYHARALLAVAWGSQAGASTFLAFHWHDPAFLYFTLFFVIGFTFICVGGLSNVECWRRASAAKRYVIRRLTDLLIAASARCLNFAARINRFHPDEVAPDEPAAADNPVTISELLGILDNSGKSSVSLELRNYQVKATKVSGLERFIESTAGREGATVELEPWIRPTEQPIEDLD